MAPIESPPLARFLSSLGKVQHHLHTVVVGLSAVEKKTAAKPDDLEIAWRADDAVGSAREARRFVLRAALIFVAEELNEYAKGVLSYRTLVGGKSSVPQDRAERIRALVDPDEVEPTYLTVAPLIVSHWRNRIVHRASNSRLDKSEGRRLLENKQLIYDSYKRIDVTKLLQDFELDRPTLKEVTVLLAMSINFVRKVDSTLPYPTSAADVRRWLKVENHLDQILELEEASTSGGQKDPRKRGKNYLITKSPRLADVYYRLGASEEI